MKDQLDEVLGLNEQINRHAILQVVNDAWNDATKRIVTFLKGKQVLHKGAAHTITGVVLGDNLQVTSLHIEPDGFSISRPVNVSIDDIEFY